MSLSKLNINLLVEKITDQYINLHSSNYSALRNPCILPSPVSAVTQEVNKELTGILKIDQQESASQLISDASKNQLQCDLEEKERDHLEEQQDLLKSSLLKSHLQHINEQKIIAELEIKKAQEHIQRLQLHLKRIKEQNIINNQKKEEVTQHHSHPSTEASPHNHTHPEAIEQHVRTEHSHPEATKQDTATTHVHSETAPDSQTTHSHPNTTQHGHQTADLESQKIELIQKIHSLEINLLRVQQLNLETRLEQFKKISQEQVELTKRTDQRRERAHARAAREKARSTDDPNLLQLSQQNRNALKEAIREEHKRLNQTKEELIQKANEISYQIYLNRLENLLSSVIKVSYPEHQALKQIIQLMQAYLVTTAEENNKKAILDKEYRAKTRLMQQMRDSEKRIEQCKTSNPQLTSANLNLAEQNKQLEITIENARNHRKNLSIAGLLFLLFTGGATGTGIAIEGGLVALTSLIFAPAAVLAFVTLSLFIAALVYAIKTNIDENQLSKNKLTMEDNHAKIEQQNKDIISLENTIIPDLKSEIDATEQEISKVAKDYMNLHQQAELQLGQARKVMVIYPSSQLFTNDPLPEVTNIEAYPFLIQPTAPFMEEPIGQASTYN
ncbi:hypothetical protein DGG96_08835 [Legionella qingyii]|uniref:LegC3 N-terminal Legionellaceae domain-containing protein n=1 Tax=Legionella qingyii TaxID=2184757 RepID=A0A317U5D6_9GAMM|nr:hypothetical protein [Legionella qingyii]PWY56036.1 hypothetical protein DGG96_08835 [Legionella qingyii]RUR22038.1 hypothetical protein ELY20_10755 [Legionella qingyii]RUR25618.1 hypothetical protein ELY16_09565 [Legionella qingyii]